MATDIIEQCAKYLGPGFAATSSFWLCQNTLQRAAGVLTLHSGRFSLFTGLYGATSLAVSTLLAFQANDIVKSNFQLNEPKPKTSWLFWDSSPTPESPQRELMRRVCVSAVLFAILGKGNLLNGALPSSIISEGVYANYWRGFVTATGEVATAAQRVKIQSLGEKYGCHHCGNKSPTSFFRGLLKPTTFIADHMPPTKMANMKNNNMIRKMFGIKVKQKLFPQCRDCFEQQGNAVRMGLHTPIYHNRLSSVHLVPALSVLLCDVKEVKDAIDGVVIDPLIKIAHEIEQIWKKL